MKTIALIMTLALGLLVTPLAAPAQQPTKVPQIGILCTDCCLAPPLEAYEAGEAFLPGLRDLGYVQGQHFSFILRSAGASYNRRPDFAADLVRLKVDVILAAEGTAVARAAKQATQRVPIVMVGVPDVVELGLVESLARPGRAT